MSDDKRLHPLSWLFAATQAAKGFVVPAFLFLFASGGQAYELWATVFVVPITLSAVLQYMVFRYRLEDDELVVRDGILTRTERHIPYARIQNLDLVQNPLHRLMGVALVRVETAGGSKPEAVIRVLALDAIEEMRARVFAGRVTDPGATVTPADEPSPVILQLPTVELAKLGIVSNKGLVVVGATVGLLTQGQWWATEQEAFLERYLGDVPQQVAGLAEALQLSVVVVILAGVVVAIALLRLLSMAWYVIQLYGFTIRYQDEDLRAEYGLFNKISSTIPSPRIQALTTTESPLHRWFRRQSVALRTVGGGGQDLDMGLEGAAPRAKSQWLAPMVETDRVADLIRRVHPEVRLDQVRWEPLAPRAWLRVFRRGLALVALGIVAAMMMVGSWALALAVPAAAVTYLHARLFVKHTAYSLTTWGVVLRHGWWDRTTRIVRYSKIQTVSLGETPFDRRLGMASVRVDTAGADRVGYTIEIPYLETAVAGGVAERLHTESSRHAFRW